MFCWFLMQPPDRMVSRRRASSPPRWASPGSFSRSWTVPPKAASSWPSRVSLASPFALSAPGSRLTTSFPSTPRPTPIPCSIESVDAHDIRFMEHALALACKGIGLASPNPTVGCVVVRDGQILGEGFHEYDSRDHAEVVALKAADEKARGATLYVSLEPCNHIGRTGPCTEAIIAAGVCRVVAAMEDPNPATSGRGFECLRAAGIEVQS